MVAVRPWMSFGNTFSHTVCNGFLTVTHWLFRRSPQSPGVKRQDSGCSRASRRKIKRIRVVMGLVGYVAALEITGYESETCWRSRKTFNDLSSGSELLVAASDLPQSVTTGYAGLYVKTRSELVQWPVASVIGRYSHTPPLSYVTVSPRT